MDAMKEAAREWILAAMFVLPMAGILLVMAAAR